MKHDMILEMVNEFHHHSSVTSRLSDAWRGRLGPRVVSPLWNLEDWRLWWGPWHLEVIALVRSNPGKRHDAGSSSLYVFDCSINTRRVCHECADNDLH